jgi:Ca-activated chloride channel homolog
VIGLGVGTSAGGMIPDGSGGFMKDENGAVVLSKLESGTLRELADATHGVYRDASGWVDLSKVLASTVEEGRKGQFVEHNTVRYVERYQWALAQAFVCLIASFWLEFPVRPKSRSLRLSVSASPKARAAVAAACLALLLHGPARAAPADPPSNPADRLSKVVARLSAEDRCSAARLGRAWTRNPHLGSAPSVGRPPGARGPRPGRPRRRRHRRALRPKGRGLGPHEIRPRGPPEEGPG